jgi:hypothetical protein
MIAASAPDVQKLFLKNRIRDAATGQDPTAPNAHPRTSGVTIIEIGGPDWETAMTALLIAAFSLVALGWMLWPR